jgi:hypothetical protein
VNLLTSPADNLSQRRLSHRVDIKPVDFILGRNVFFVNAIMMLIVKWMTMTFCWGFAIFVAPIGLAYLYFARGRSGAAA